MDFPAWSELRAALVPATLGALFAVCTMMLIQRLLRRRLRSSGGESDAERVDLGLRGFASEVESRLDAKLDRLEALLREARGISGLAGPSTRTVEPALRVPPEARSRWDSLGTVSSADRNRVLQLAQMGELPEAIADTVGLLRGEVDLILRLHRGIGKSESR